MVYINTLVRHNMASLQCVHHIATSDGATSAISIQKLPLKFRLPPSLNDGRSNSYSGIFQTIRVKDTGVCHCGFLGVDKCSYRIT